MLSESVANRVMYLTHLTVPWSVHSNVPPKSEQYRAIFPFNKAYIVHLMCSVVNGLFFHKHSMELLVIKANIFPADTYKAYWRPVDQ